MSDISANLSLPYIQPSQAQKHVTHNEGMRRLDTLVQLMVLAADQTTPPAAPQDGDGYLVPDSAVGAWAGQTGNIAVYENNTWSIYFPKSGWVIWVDTPGEQRVFDGTSWKLAADAMTLQNLEFVGISTTADTTNRLAVSADATLLTHAGSGHQLKLNKAGEGSTASLLFQTDWSARAELGTTGTDNFEIKVSDDGSTFYPAMIAKAGTGKVQFPSGVEGLTRSEFGDGPLLTTGYSTSKGVDLVTNSTGLLGNGYNYPPEFNYDPIVTPNLPASLYFSGHHSGPVQMEELLPVDPNQIYRLKSYIRQEGLAGDWSAFANGERHRQFMGLIALDADQQTIEAKHHMRYRHSGNDSLTTLTVPLSPGDTTVTVSDASGWNESDAASYLRGIIFFGYKSISGFAYEHYSQIVEFDLFDLGQVNKTTNVITLNKPLPTSMGNPDDAGGVWPIGTKLSNSSSGSSFKYAFYSAAYVPEVNRWYQTTGHIGGIDTSGTNYGINFPPGTTFVRPFWLPNHTNRVGGYSGHPDTGAGHKVWYTGASVTPEPLGALSEVLVGSSAGRKEIKVPTTDYGSGTISLVSASQSIEPI